MMKISNFIKLASCFILVLGLKSSNAQELAKKYKGLPCINKTFQVHAHVVLDSLGVANYTADNLRAALVSTSAAFAPICASFELCSFDTITNYEFDSIGTNAEPEEMKQLFHLKNRINIYLETELQDPGTCGFATLSGVAQMNNGSIFLKCQGGGTLTHEMGHLFGLLHTFEGSGIELVNGDKCKTEGDIICDTPSDTFVDGDQMSEYINPNNCEFISIKRDSNNIYYQPDVGNFMSYYPCSCGFTRGQFILMANTFLESDPKMW